MCVCTKSANAGLWGQPAPPPALPEPGLRRRRPARSYGPADGARGLLAAPEEQQRRVRKPTPRVLLKTEVRDSPEATFPAWVRLKTDLEVQNFTVTQDWRKGVARRVTLPALSLSTRFRDHPESVQPQPEVRRTSPKYVPSSTRPLSTDFEVQRTASPPRTRSNSGTNPFLENDPGHVPLSQTKRVDGTDSSFGFYRSLATQLSDHMDDPNVANPKPKPPPSEVSASGRTRSSDPRVRAAAPCASAPRRHRSSRYGTMIGDTVESWARAAAQQRTNKPLVFGGTYPIDEPTYLPADTPTLHHKPETQSPVEEHAYTQKPRVESSERSLASSKESILTHRARVNNAERSVTSSTELIVDPETHRRYLRETIERSVEKFEALLAAKGGDIGLKGERSVSTFAIDEPLDLYKEQDTLSKDEDSRYYVSEPETFDIDEPIFFI